MSNEQDETRDEGLLNLPDSFNSILPRTIFAEADPERLDKKGQTFTGIQGLAGVMGQIPTIGAGNNILRNPSRRFYDPEITTTSIHLPRTIKQKNRWNRWFYDHDELIGVVLDTHAELPYSRAELVLAEEDPHIQQEIEDCVHATNFFSMLPIIDLEFMKVGEVFIHTPWDNTKGRWSHIIIHNPDFVEVKFTPFADQECVIELIPDDELKSIVHSTKPENQQLKKRIPEQIFRRVLTGKNITLDPDEVTHIARRSNSYDIRGTSIISRLFRTLMYEDKLRESQITIADNFIYPLKIFKLGDPKKGWIPNETHQRALAQMLQQATFDPNFSLIYHYGLSVEYVTVADKVMKLDKEWTEISERKMIALGIGKAFLAGESSMASANVTLQMQMARYKAKRDLFETRWMHDKFFKILAEKNEWYQRDKKELVGHYRVSRSAEEKKKRLIIPKILWHKKLMMRDDQAFLTFLNNVYAQGKGPLSAITLLQYMGLSLDEELDNKQKQRLLEEKIGALTHPSVGGPTGMGGGSVASKLKDIFTKKKKGVVGDTTIIDDIAANAKIFDDSENFDPNTKILIGNENPSLTVLKPTVFDEKEADYIVATTKMLYPAEEKIWLANLNSPNIPSEVILQMFNLNNKLNILDKKHNGEFKEGVLKDKSDIIKILTEIYKQGKLNAFGITEFFPIYKQYYATNEELTEYSDLVMKKEFESWIDSLLSADIEKTALLKHIRNLGNSCFCYGQLKGFQEQGIYQVKIGNVLSTDGIRYGVKDLLSKGWNVGKIIAPKDEIILLYPCIEGFEDEEFHNSVDPHIVRQKSFTVAGIDVENCPIEFSPVIIRYLNKVGSFIKRKWDVLEFVKDVIDLDEWEEATLKDIQKKANLDIANVEDKKMRSTIEASLVTYERIKKRGSVATLEHKRRLYISTWLGIEDRSLVDNLIRYVDILDEGTEKIIRKSFKRANYDLNQQELETFSIFGHIEQISKGASAWYVAKKDDADVDYRVRQGKMWDAKGKCLNNTEKDEVQIFKDNLRLWVDYPHFLDDEIRKSFEAL